MLVRVRQERQETRALDCRSKLPLVVRASTRDTARDDLTGLADVLFQCREILIVDLLNTLGSEATEFFSSKIACHGLALLFRFGIGRRFRVGLLIIG